MGNGCHVGFHVGFELSGYGGGHHGKDTDWVPCWRPCWCAAFRVWSGCSKRTLPSWAEVLEPLCLPLHIIWNLSWTPASVPAPEAPAGVSRVRNLRADAPPIKSTWNLNLEPGKCPRGLAPGGPTRNFPCWAEVLEPSRLPVSLGSRKVSPWLWCPLPLLGRSPRASVSRWVNVESYLEPVECVTFMLGKLEKVSV